MKKECLQEKLEFFSGDVVLCISFGLNRSGSVFLSLILPVKKSYLYEKRIFFHRFFCWIDTHPRDVLKWYLEFYNISLTWYEKQGNIVKMYHCHFILLLVPDRRATPDTNVCPQNLPGMLIFQTKNVSWKKSACSKS